jgi:hypothetical protein
MGGLPPKRTKYSEAATRGNLELELFLHGGFTT